MLIDIFPHLLQFCNKLPTIAPHIRLISVAKQLFVSLLRLLRAQARIALPKPLRTSGTLHWRSDTSKFTSCSDRAGLFICSLLLLQTVRSNAVPSHFDVALIRHDAALFRSYPVLIRPNPPLIRPNPGLIPVVRLESH